MAENVSPKKSLKGWKFWEWAKGNKEAIKIVVSVGFGLWVPVNPVAKALVGAASKLVLDTIDFYINKVELPK